MGVDYYNESEEISEFAACAAKILQQYSPEQWVKAKQECVERFKSLCEDEDFKHYAAEKISPEQIAEVLAGAERYTYDNDGELMRGDWCSWIEEAFALYMKVYDEYFCGYWV